MRYFLSICCLAAILCSSLPALAMELTEFESRCTMGLGTNDKGMCADKKDICGSFMDLMAKATDAAACKKACADAEAAENPRHVMDGCAETVQHAYSECTIYCESLK